VVSRLLKSIHSKFPLINVCYGYVPGIVHLILLVLLFDGFDGLVGLVQSILENGATHLSLVGCVARCKHREALLPVALHLPSSRTVSVLCIIPFLFV
jgi:hypothetical protein